MYFYIRVITFQPCICLPLGSLYCYFRSLHNLSIVLYFGYGEGAKWVST